MNASMVTVQSMGCTGSQPRTTASRNTGTRPPAPLQPTALNTTGVEAPPAHGKISEENVRIVIISTVGGVLLIGLALLNLALLRKRWQQQKIMAYASLAPGRQDQQNNFQRAHLPMNGKLQNF